MENATKGLLMAATLIIVILLIGIGFNVANKSESAVDAGLKEIDKMTTQLSENSYTQYDGNEITGAEVKNAIKRFATEKICIKVNNGKQETEYIYNESLTTDLSANVTDMLLEANDKGNLSKYINPNAIFLGRIVRDPDTDAIIGITFTKQ